MGNTVVLKLNHMVELLKFTFNPLIVYKIIIIYKLLIYHLYDYN